MSKARGSGAEGGLWLAADKCDLLARADPENASNASQALATGNVSDPESAVVTVEEAQLAMQLAVADPHQGDRSRPADLPDPGLRAPSDELPHNRPLS